MSKRGWKKEFSLGEMQNSSFDEAARTFKVISYGYTGSAYAALPAAPTTPTIYNVNLTTVNTEYSQALPSGTKKVDIKLRGLGALLKIAFTSGASGSTYITVPYGASLHLEGVNLTGITVYAQSSTASQVLEIVSWV